MAPVLKLKCPKDIRRVSPKSCSEGVTSSVSSKEDQMYVKDVGRVNEGLISTDNVTTH